MKNKKKVLFLGRNNDDYTYKILKILKKNFFYVESIFSKKHYQKLPKKILNKKFDFVLSFRNYIILPKRFLKLNKLSINIHPGPPNYRGIGCLNYAIYNDEKYYGITCHFIDEKVDAGEIIIYKKFKMPKKNNVSKLLNKTTRESFRVTKYLIKLINKENYEYDLLELVNKNSTIKWSNKIYKKKDLENLYKIKKNYDKKKINLIIKSTLYKNYKPYILNNGVKKYFTKII
ncbi:formyltransferase family protein [Candidatus Pelagibacter sp.]|nr:formyltransferase family protein [Candidatus Pelagibacter sp.]